MAQIVLGLGTSHTPMLNAALEDWLHNFASIDPNRVHRDKNGRQVGYDALLRQADPRAESWRDATIMTDRYRRAQDALRHLSETLADARLDSLIVIGDDQDELLHADNQPAFLIFWVYVKLKTVRFAWRGVNTDA